FQIADVKMEVACLIDDISVPVFCRADVHERTVPVLEGKPLELAVLFMIEYGDCVYSLVVGVAVDIDSFVVACPASDDAGGAIVYWGKDGPASRLHTIDTD